MTSPFPGFAAPAAGFEQPFEMLAACHERMRRSLALLARLIDHVAANGHDAKSRSAASNLLRYFDLAAALHDQDEQRHVFPLLAAADDPGLAAAVERLHHDHVRMEGLWAGLRATLDAWSRPDAVGRVDASLREQAAAFDCLYAAHLRTEEEVVFPAARSRIDAARLASMSAEMLHRRRDAAGA